MAHPDAYPIALTDAQAAAWEEIRAWFLNPGAKSAFHLAVPYGRHASALITHITEKIGTGQVALGAPTGREAANLEQSTGTRALTVHRLLYTTRKDGRDNRFVPRGDGPLWDREIQLVIVMSAERVKAREVAHLLSPGKRLLLVADPNNPDTPRDSFLDERTPDHLLDDPTRLRQLAPWARERAHDQPRGRIMDGIERWLADRPRGSWMRLNPDDHDGTIGALAMALKRQLPDAVLLGTETTFDQQPSFVAAFDSPRIDRAEAERAARRGQPVIVLSNLGDLVKPGTLAQWALEAPVILVTRQGATGPLVYDQFAGGHDTAGMTVISRTGMGDMLSLESENGQPVRIVVQKNDHVNNLYAGEVFAKMG